MSNQLLPDRLEKLLTEADPADPGPRRTVPAVALFMDISGFTPLTEALMEAGDKVGAEALAKIVNDLFQPVIKAVYARGGYGYISGFAGDAFTAIFETEGNTAPRAAYAALAAAQTIHGLFKDRVFHLGGRAFRLAVKIGLGAGMVEYGVLGPATQRAYYFRGSAIDTCAEAEKHCRTGQIVVSTALQAQWGVAGKPVAEGFVELLDTEAPTLRLGRPFPAVATALAAAFFPESLLETTVAGEFRQLATVFIAFRGFDQTALNEFATTVRREVAARDGYFNRLDFGDKGGNCLVMFGAPTAHENDVARALQLALLLRDRYRDQVRLGVTQGQMYFGRVGIPERCEFTALGNAVNFAARLMMRAAWGQVWVAPEVATRGDFMFTSLGAFPYKGFAAPVPTFELRHAQAAEEPLFTQPMVGREDELGRLIAWTEPLFAGQFAGAAAVYGEAGMGKSRLTYALRAALGARVLWLTAPADGILRQDFNPFAYVLRRYFGQTPAATPAANRAAWETHFAALLAALDPTAPLRAELERAQTFLGALVGLHWPASLYEQADPQLRYDNTLFALKAFILALTHTRPVVVELDDAHWLDAHSRAALALLTRQVAPYPLAVLFNSRYLDDGSRPPWPLDSDVPVVTLELHTLTPEALRALAEQQLGGAVSEALLTLVQDKTGANPFFAQQLLLYLFENHQLTRPAAGAWAAHDLPRDLPLSVNAVLVARLDRLHRRVKEVVQTAAVLGREFDLRLLTQMLHTEAAVAPAVQTAERNQIWSALAELRYIFKHMLLRDAAYQMQLRSRLRELHWEALKAYKKFYEADLQPHYADLAYHAEHSGDVTQQQTYYRLAGDAAQKAYRNEAAAGWWEKLLPLLPTPAEQVALRIELGTLYQRMEQWETAQAHYEKALAQAAGLEPESGSPLLARAAHEFGVFWREWGSRPLTTAREWLEKARATRAALGAHQDLGQTLTELGVVVLRLGETALAQAYLQDSQRLAQQLGDLKGAALSLQEQGYMLNQLGEAAAARQANEACLAAWTALGDKRGMAFANKNLGNMLYNQGEFARARQHYRASLQLYAEIGDRKWESLLWNNLGNAQVALNEDYAEARQYYAKTLRLRRELGDKQGLAIVLNNMGTASGQLGELAAARAYLTEALSIARVMEDQGLIAMSLSNLAPVAIAERQLAEARALLAESVQIRWKIQRPVDLLYSLVRSARLAQLQMEESATPAQAQHAWQRLVVLCGVVHAQQTALGMVFQPSDRRLYAELVALAQTALAAATYAAHFARGSAMTLGEAVAFALEEGAP